MQSADDIRREFKKQFGEVVELSNPAVAKDAAKRPPRRPMSTVRRSLEVKPIPGYKLYWFKEANVEAALDAYYEFVNRDEVYINQKNPAGDSMRSGNTDMGSRVSLVAGQNAAGEPVRLFLMKLPLELFKEDQQELAKRNALVAEAIFGEEALQVGQATEAGQPTMKELDPHSYVNPERTALFNRKRRVVKPKARVIIQRGGG